MSTIAWVVPEDATTCCSTYFVSSSESATIDPPLYIHLGIHCWINTAGYPSSVLTATYLDMHQYFCHCWSAAPMQPPLAVYIFYCISSSVLYIHHWMSTAFIRNCISIAVNLLLCIFQSVSAAILQLQKLEIYDCKSIDLLSYIQLFNSVSTVLDSPRCINCSVSWEPKGSGRSDSGLDQADLCQGRLFQQYSSLFIICSISPAIYPTGL